MAFPRHEATSPRRGRLGRPLTAGALVLLALAGCGDGSPAAPAATAVAAPMSALLHLDTLLPGAAVSCGAAPESARGRREWTFAPEPDGWRALSAENTPRFAAVTLAPVADGLRVSLARAGQPQGRGPLLGGLAVDVDGGPLTDWDAVLVRARTHDRLLGIAASYNVDEPDGLPGPWVFFGGEEGSAPVFSDGSIQTYALPLLARAPQAADAAPVVRNLGLFVCAPAAAGIDILSVTLVPRGADFLEDRGVRPVSRGDVTRETLFAHTPASFTFDVTVPDGGRLDLGLGCVAGDPVVHRISARAGDGAVSTLLEETVGDGAAWRQRSVDLSKFARRTVALTLEASSARPGAVALWGAPVLSGHAGPFNPTPPNVIFYVIDGGGADEMSVYGYARRTTPFLEKLAQEGVVFERAHSNSTWTQSSTASFMTSLQHSVLGGLSRGVHSTPVPAAAETMAEHLRAGGWMTGVFTSNPNCARMIGLQRGVDVMHDTETESHATSSVDLQAMFWRFREDYSGGPFWVHFQSTDVHEPSQPPPPFSGMFVTAEERARSEQLGQQVGAVSGDLFGTTSIVDLHERALKRAGVDRHEFFSLRRGLYDETMAHQDHQLEQFVGELKARGEWEHTILIISADHGHPAGTFARFGRGLIEPQPEGWQGALCDSYATRVPLIVVWPGHIPGGRRIAEPVSLIDVLPTVLDLAGLPPPAMSQGHSLAGLLLSERTAFEPRERHPVFLDEFRVDDATGELVGNLDIIDGRWGASLEIGPHPQGTDALHGRHSVPAGGRWGAVHPFFPDVPRLLLYDLQADPYTVHAVNEEQPELVERYRTLLLAQWDAHRALALQLRASGSGEADGAPALTPEQLQQLQQLGYIR